MSKQNEAQLPKKPESYWIHSTDVPKFPQLEENIHVDVAIVGGGISGITTAHQLANNSDYKIALLESTKLLNGTTGHTTAKVTAQHGLIYDQLITNFGIEKAKLYYQANVETAQWIESYIRTNNIDCDYRNEHAYVYTTSEKNVDKLRKEAVAYEKIGIPGGFVEDIPLQIKSVGAVMMENQAQYHPLKYLNHLVHDIQAKGVQIYEQSTAIKMENGEPATIFMENGVKVTANYIVSASHFPFHDGRGYFARLYPKRSYVVAARSEQTYPGGMYISVGKPTRSFRSVTINGEEMILVIGDGHKTGQGKPEIEHYKALEQDAKQIFSANEIPYHWSAQDLVTPDNIPYIGRISKGNPNVFVATGFRKWGMIHGTFAGFLINDLIKGEENRYEELYNPSRFKMNPNFKKIVQENMNVASHLIGGKLERPVKEIEEIKKGEGAAVTFNGQKAGAYKCEKGNLFVVDTTCTHMGCEVNWNSGDQTWDCPCHGSRFSYKGEVIEGPADEPLERLQIDHEE